MKIILKYVLLTIFVAAIILAPACQSTSQSVSPSTSQTTSQSINQNTSQSTGQTISRGISQTTSQSTKYSLNTRVNPAAGGIVAPATGTYDAGSNIQVAAQPAPGYSFDSWSGDITGTSSSITITMDRSKTVTANFKSSTVEIELPEAQKQDLISVQVAGSGSLTRVSLQITSKSDNVLKILILPGIIFEASSAQYQNMVVITRKEITVQPHVSIESTNVDAACVNMEKDLPGNSNNLVLSNTQAPPDLMLLLNLLDFSVSSTRVKQFAVWTITDNPSRSGYVGITGTSGTGGLTDSEIQNIRVLFQKAGIDTSKYQALK